MAKKQEKECTVYMHVYDDKNYTLLIIWLQLTDTLVYGVGTNMHHCTQDDR